MLSGNEIRIQQQSGGLWIEDFEESRLGPNSYNLRLADELMVYSEMVLDPKQKNRTHLLKIPDSGIVLHPGILYLARTMERTRTLQYVPMLSGRSSTGRLGIGVEVSAGFGDVGFDGYWTLELTCVQPVLIYPGMEICQIYYEPLEGERVIIYQGKYQNNSTVQASQLYRDFEDSMA